MVCHMSYKDESGDWVHPSNVVANDSGTNDGEKYCRKDNGASVRKVAIEKMSKSKKNTIEIDDIIKEYGADAARLFVSSDSPPERNIEWSTNGISKVHKYLSDIYDFITNFLQDKQADSDVATEKNEGYISAADSDSSINKDLNALSKEEKDFLIMLNQTIYNVTNNMDSLYFNKVVANLREFSNYMTGRSSQLPRNLLKYGLEAFLKMFYPIIPHVVEELWKCLGYTDYMQLSAWPKVDDRLMESSIISIPVQINGKTYAVIDIAPDEEQNIVEEIAKEMENVKKVIGGRSVKKVVYVKNRVINFVCV